MSIKGTEKPALHACLVNCFFFNCNLYVNILKTEKKTDKLQFDPRISDRIEIYRYWFYDHMEEGKKPWSKLRTTTRSASGQEAQPSQHKHLLFTCSMRN